MDSRRNGPSTARSLTVSSGAPPPPRRGPRPAVLRRGGTPGAAVLAALLAVAALGSAAGAEETCADCHEVAAEFPLSVHGVLACTDCHAGAAEVPHREEALQANCADCHGDAVEDLGRGIHGQPSGEAGLEPPACADCHGDVHRLAPRADPRSPVHPARLAETCGGCHGGERRSTASGLLLVRPVEAYLASVHARAVAAGETGADCASCHGGHLILRAEDPESRVHRRAVVATCGECHGEIAAAYAASIHGRAAAQGVREAPVCTDCHGEHRILGALEEGSPISASNIPRLTCGRCHGDLRLAEKFGLDPSKVPAYEDSFHGLAIRSGAVTVAHCGSCHGIHDILPSSDPRATIHPANLARTCGECHPGAGTSFAIGTVHVRPEQPEHAAVYWIRAAYLWLIVFTIGGMVLHNALDLYRKAKDPALRSYPLEVEQPERMSLAFRLTHGLLAASFLVLVWTGFALKYPEAWWARPLLGWEDRIGLRGGIHRTAAIVLLATAAVHAVHLARSRRARACMALMRPGRDDWAEVKERLAYFFGRRPAPPEAPWIGYSEKIEYLAVVWGTVIMSATGFVLWFQDLALRWMPKWVTDVATVIHFYEAVLATLAIFVWHFYSVIFDPLVYPLDPAFWTGRSAPGRARERRHARPPA